MRRSKERKVVDTRHFHGVTADAHEIFHAAQPHRHLLELLVHVRQVDVLHFLRVDVADRVVAQQPLSLAQHHLRLPQLEFPLPRLLLLQVESLLEEPHLCHL